MAETLLDYAFVSLDEVKDWIGGKVKEVSDYDDWLTVLINRVTDFMEQNLVFRRIKVRDTAIEEIRDGNGEWSMLLKNPPIQELTAIQFKYELDLDATACADEEQVRVDPEVGEVRLMQRTFTKGYRNIKFIYKGGWSTVPNPLKQACVMLVKRLYKLQSRSNETIVSISRSGESINYLVEKLVDQDIALLVANYVRPRIA